MWTVLVCKEGFWEKKWPKFKFKTMSNKSKKEAFFKTFLFLIFLVLVLLLIDVDKISNIFENSSDGSSKTAEFRGLYPFLDPFMSIWFLRFGWRMGKTSGLFYSSRFWKWTEGKRWSFMVPVSSLLCHGGLLLRWIAWNEVRLHKFRFLNAYLMSGQRT